MAKAKRMKAKHIKKTEQKDNIAIKQNLKNKRNCIIIVFFIIFIFSTIKLTIWFTSNISMQNQIQELKEEVIVNNESQTEEPPTKKIDFEKIKQINSDVVAWIEIPNTTIEYPVFQTKDNEYYLKKDMYKNYNTAGSIFMDYENIADFNDDNTVIYGHNLLSGNMFADLQKIVNNQLGNNIKIHIYTPDKEKQYLVFSSYISEPTKEPIQVIISDKQDFIEKAIKKSYVNFSIMPSIKDKILTLSTCDNKGKRIIVHAIETTN